MSHFDMKCSKSSVNGLIVAAGSIILIVVPLSVPSPTSAKIVTACLTESWRLGMVNDHRLKAVASGYGLKPD